MRLQRESSTVVHSDNGWTPTVQTATAYLETLNPEQRRAVEHGAAGGADRSDDRRGELVRLSGAPKERVMSGNTSTLRSSIFRRGVLVPGY